MNLRRHRLIEPLRTKSGLQILDLPLLGTDLFENSLVVFIGLNQAVLARFVKVVAGVDLVSRPVEVILKVGSIRLG